MCTFAKIGKTVNSRKLLTETIGKITLPETADELRETALVLLEHVTGLSRTALIAGSEIDEVAVNRICACLPRLNRGEPLQYITGEAWFYGRTFKVSPAVLIPRPETEELIDLIKTLLPPQTPATILDVGTGSGCLAITLKLEMPACKVMALDVSTAALQLAQSNATLHQTHVDFFPCDFLNQTPHVAPLDLLVSNPPYLSQQELSTLQTRVKDFEPHQALFVPGNDPLVFYRALACKGKTLLKPGGWVVAEIHEQRGAETAAVFTTEKYQNVKTIKDLSSKDRMVMAQRV